MTIGTLAPINGAATKLEARPRLTIVRNPAGPAALFNGWGLRLR